MDKPKPKPKREVAVRVHDGRSLIEFNASRDAAEEFSEFGNLYGDSKAGYTLFVDHRFDFEEVLDYIEQYG